MVNLARLAVQTGCVLLYEVDQGKRKLSKRFGTRPPVQTYLEHQARFHHVLKDPEALAAIQLGVDERYETVSRTMA